MKYTHVVIQKLYCILHQRDYPNLSAISMKRHSQCFVNTQVTDFYIQIILNPCACIVKKDHQELILQPHFCAGVRCFQQSFDCGFGHIVHFPKMFHFLNLNRCQLTGQTDILRPVGRCVSNKCVDGSRSVILGSRTYAFFSESQSRYSTTISFTVPIALPSESDGSWILSQSRLISLVFWK